MTEYLTPNLAVLPEPQRLLWPELKNTPSDFVLYGGTALALRFGHRVSVDFDFFSNRSFEPEKLYKKVPYLKNSDIQQIDKNTLTCVLDRNGPVQVSFFGGLRLGCVNYPEKTLDHNLQVASILDIGASKARVVLLRPAWKDYIDLNMILKNGENLTNILSAAYSLYEKPYSPILSLKALSFFDDIDDKSKLDAEIKNHLLKAVSEVKIENIQQIKIHKNITIEHGISL